MKSGLYGCFRLDGGPISPSDCAALGLEIDQNAAAGVARGVDLADPGAIRAQVDDNGTFHLQGYVEDCDALAARLGLSRNTPMAQLARAAIAHFGGDAPIEMAGEWSALSWSPHNLQLTLVQSQTVRDPLYYVQHGARVAVASDIYALRRLDWVTDALNIDGLYYALAWVPGHYGTMTQAVMTGVHSVEGGTCVKIDRGSVQVSEARTLRQAPLWRGSFEDAVGEADRILRDVIRARVVRQPRLAVFISGGLDSSLLSALVAGERAPGQTLQLIASAAPPGSDLIDETAFAQIVADHLSVPMACVVPPPVPNVYRPSAATMADANGPPLSPRHYLYEALAVAAAQSGCPLVFDGCYGEMTLTRHYIHPPTPVSLLKDVLRPVRDAMIGRKRNPRFTFQGFGVRLAAHRAKRVPAALQAKWARPVEYEYQPGLNDPIGLVLGGEVAARAGTELLSGQVRSDFPLRDRRLLMFCSGFPTRFIIANGLDRAPGRHMLTGLMPDSIRLRPKGTAFSPDYYQRLQQDAADARARIPLFRRADADDWLDLDWLDAALARVGRNGADHVTDAFEVQLTAITAEFISEWRRAEL